MSLAFIFKTVVILGRPFLVTVNVIINCSNSSVKLLLKNITIELDVLNICKQTNFGFDEVWHINSIEEIHEVRDIISLCISDLLEDVLIMDDGFLERLNLDDATQLIKCMNDAYCSHIVGWIPKKEVYKELPLQKLIPSNTETPILEL